MRKKLLAQAYELETIATVDKECLPALGELFGKGSSNSIRGTCDCCIAMFSHFLFLFYEIYESHGFLVFFSGVSSLGGRRNLSFITWCDYPELSPTVVRTKDNSLFCVGVNRF